MQPTPNLIEGAPAQRTVLGLDQLFNFHSYLSSVKEPNETITKCKTAIETHIFNIISSFQTEAPKQ